MPTDVLSFPEFEFTPGCPPEDAALCDVATGLLPLGDMVLSMAVSYTHLRPVRGLPH